MERRRVETPRPRRDDVAIVLIRVLVGWVFVSEGIQKFIFPASLGVGRFAKIGIPSPAVMAPFVGVVETVCGALILIGLLTRLVTLPLIISLSISASHSIRRSSCRSLKTASGVHCTRPEQM
jgi:uncharacterized membrane protein YphA (DoxX/SURF4 family)